ncbi:MAG TPA: hypothetical protein PK280_07465 [Planctomycetota bacterium]|nr:hypothetical protein [Planctomycetota bacterium]
MTSKNPFVMGFAALIIAQLGFLANGCQGTPTVRQAPSERQPARVRLKDDAVYADRLTAALNAAPASVATPEDRLDWHLEVARAAFDARAYDVAATHYRAAIALCPTWDVLYANLSVAMGKLGRFSEAEAQGLKAVALKGRGAMHANMVLASWEWHLGKERQAVDRIKSVTEPTEPWERHVYYNCLACFYASVGDEQQIEKAMTAALKLAPGIEQPGVSRTFFARDVVFDRYRRRPWFIKLIGETLAEPGSPGP